jgi:uncharacterized protein (TIGR02284 family)
MENTATETRETLNDLILINNDRIEGYQKALDDIKSDDDAASNADLVALFGRNIEQSRNNRMELGKEVQVAGGEMEDGTLNSGKLHRAWMEVKAFFTGNDRHAILASCESGEDAILKAYKDALEEEHLPAFLREMLTKQRADLKQAHDEIKALRDQAK